MNYETQVSKGQYRTGSKVTTSTLIRSVYMWMCTALLLTGATASLVAGSEALLQIAFFSGFC